jgi:hypothetical protein
MACTINAQQPSTDVIETLADLANNIICDKQDVFAQIPHIDKLPKDIYCCIKLKDEMKTVTTKTYSTPRKYKDTWDILIQQHLDAGRI